MKTKKLIGLLLAASMLPTMTLAHADEADVLKASHCDIPSGWKVDYHTENTSWNKEQDYAGIEYGAGVDGGNALYVNLEAPAETHKYIKVSAALAGALESNVTYRIAFDGKQVDNSANFVCRFNWLHEVSFSGFTAAGDAGNGLTHYYADVAIGSTAPTTFDIYFDRKQAYLIDNLSLQKVVDGVADGTELILGGDMETVTYSFDVAGENYELSKDWNFHWREKKGKFNRAVDIAKPTKKYARTGDYALHIKNTVDALGDTYYRVKNDDFATASDDKYGKFQYEAGQYKLEYWAKPISYKRVKSGTSWFTDVAIGDMKTNIVDENGWRKFEKTFTITQEQVDDRNYGTSRFNDYFAIMVEGPCELVIDDINFYKVPAEGEDAVNLVVDGGFENSSLSHEEAEGNAFTDPDTYRVFYGSAITAAEKGDTYYVEPTSREKYAGNYAMHLVAGGTSSESEHYSRLARTGITWTKGKYNVSFYAKGRYGLGKFGIGWDGTNWLRFFDMKKSATDENGWIKYSGTVTKQDDEGYWQFIADYGTDMYIDNIEIYAADDTTKAEMGTGNLALGGDFEEVSVVPEKGTDLIHPMAFTTKDGKGLNISWTNPAQTHIEDIDVYVNGNPVKNCVLNLDKSAFNEMLVTGLAPNKEYTIQVVMNIDGTPVTNTFTGITDAIGQNFTRGGWDYNRFSNLTKKSAYRENQTYPDYANANFSLDSTEKASGNNSLRLDINLPDKKAKCYPNISQTVNVRRDTAYIFSMKYKTKDVPGVHVTVEYWDRDEAGNEIHHSWDTKNVPVSDEWTTFTCDLSTTPCDRHDECGAMFYNPDDNTTTYDMRVVIDAQKGTGSVWFDDIALHQSFGGTAFGDNLYTNGGFEYTYEIQEPVYKANNETITNVAPGKMEVTAKIKNYAVDNLNGMVVVALYKDGKLVNTALVEKEISITPLVIPAEEITQTIETPADITDGDYEVKVFYWNGSSELKSLDVNDVLVEAN